MLGEAAVRPATDFEIVFPTTEEISLSGGRVLSLRRIPLPNFPALADAYVKLAQMAESGVDLSTMIQSIGTDIVDLLRPCVLNTTLETLDASDLPDILEKFIAMNFSEDVLGKWWGLLQKVVDRVPGGPEALKQATKRLGKSGLSLRK
jgi:hypothetical protein